MRITHTRYVFSALAICVGLSTPAIAQPDVVAHVKADLVARGVSLAGTCGAFEITRRVVWLLRSEGWGPIRKAGGENCAGFSGDKMVASSGRFVDLLIDQGGANTPAWQERAASTEELAARVDPMDPGDAPAPTGPPIVVPPSGPPTALSVDYDRIAALVKADGDLTRAKVDDPNWLEKVLGNRYVQMALTAVGTYYSTKAVIK